jgi:hypothetical protein
MKVPIGGGASVVLAAGQRNCTRPVVDAASVYWGDQTGGTITKVPIGGGPPVLVTSSSLVIDLAIAGSDIVFADGYTLAKAPLAGGPATAIGTAAGAPLMGVAVDDASAYFTSYGTIWKAPLDGGEALALAANQGSASAIAVDDTSVYWTNGTAGQVLRLTPK